MQDIIYDIHSKSQLILGYAGETNARNAVFKGFNKVNEYSSIVINIKGIGSRPLANFSLPATYTYTKNEGTYEAYLCELITDSNGKITYERHSNNFEILIKHSEKLGAEATPASEQFDDWSAEITGAIADMYKKAEDGEFDGADGFSPTVSISKVGRTTTITITDKSGAHTATITDGADGGAYDDTSIKNRLDAIEEKETGWDAKAESSDIPTKVSELQNDSGYATEHWVKDKGYLTEHQDISGKANVGDSYTKTESDGKYLTEHQDISGKVDKVEGKELSTNDYDNDAKSKVDAIPTDPKYTDTVYDDTAVKGRLDAIEGKEESWDNKSDFSGSYNDLSDKPTIPSAYDDTEIKEDISSLNDDLANYNNTKVGYSEVENGQLKMYSDSTKAHLLATLDLPNGGISDATINGNSIVNSDGVAVIPNGNSSTIGVYRTNSSLGVGIYETANGNVLQTEQALVPDITARTSYFKVITPYNLVKSVDSVICSDSASEALTSEQQNKALARLGIINSEGVMFGE